MHQILGDFATETVHLFLTRRLDQMIINKKKKLAISWIFTIPVNYTVKVKEREKIDKNFDRELKKLWNMIKKVILIVTGSLVMFPDVLGRKLLKPEIRARIKKWNNNKWKRKICTWTLLGNRKTVEHESDWNTNCQ